ncbi:MFS transporter [Actinomadura verrucosospora]|uniref:MFS transporter n=2 Tax=Thermomonosporaceae TaxID=2012 RepID=UPI0033DA0F48
MTPPRAGRREWIALAVLALPALLVSVDMFVMIMALPELSVALGASGTEQLWIMDVYGFMVAGFLVAMGALGDRIGRRRLLLAGAAAFGAASCAAAFAASPAALIAARAVLGVAGAALTPCTLGMITTMFADPRQRASAIGVWAGCFTLGAIAGPLAGGLLLDHFWWGSVLLLGVPAMVPLLLAGPFLLPEHRDPSAGRLDAASVALSLATILPAVYGVKELAAHGPRPLPAAALAAGIAAGALFVRRQRRLPDPLLDVSLFRGRVFAVVMAALTVFPLASGGAMTFIAQRFQLVDGLSPLETGAVMLPGMLAALASFQAAPLLGRRVRPGLLLPGGMAVAVAGFLGVAAAPDATALAAAFAVTCLGSGPLVSVGTAIVLGSLPPERAGSAAGLSQTGNELGTALGVALLGSVGTIVYRAAPGLPPAAREGLAHAVARGSGVAEARAAFTTELHVIALVCAVLLAAVAVLVARTLRHLPVPGPAEAPAPDPVLEGAVS